MGAVLSLNELRTAREQYRQNAKRVVFTNGVFDIIHRGHIEFLARARELGDVLIVGINTDESVRRIKGDKRPIVQEDDRAYVVAHLTPVDFVCKFGEETPLNVIRALVPDILVKGADWKIDAIVGKEVVERAGGKVATIEFIPDRSTSNIIDRIIERFSQL